MAPLWRRCGLTSGRLSGRMPSMSGVQRACKPGSVAKTGQARSPDGHSSGPGVAPWFSRPTTAAARKPALSRRGRNTLRYLGLLRVGFTLPLPLLVARCALTAPFHPYPCRNTGGLLSVALSLSSRSPGVTRHPVSVEPGLSSPIRRPARPSSPLLGLVLNQGWGGVKLF